MRYAPGELPPVLITAIFCLPVITHTSTSHWRGHWATERRTVEFSMTLRAAKREIPKCACRTIFVVATLSLWIPGFVSPQDTAAQTISEQITALLRTQIEEATTPPPDSLPIPSQDPLEVIPSAPEQNSSADPNGSSTLAPPNTPSTESTAPPLPKPTPPPLKLFAGKDPIRAARMLVRFYEGRAYRPAWHDNSGPLARADLLLSTIEEEAERQGLKPRDYRLEKLKTLLSAVRHVQ